MPKLKFKDFKNTQKDNQDLREFYREKYRALFQQAWTFPELSEGQNYFFKNLLRYQGSALCFTLKEKDTPKDNSVFNIKGAEVEGENTLIITPYATTYYNLYNEITQCYPVRKNGATFVPLFPKDSSLTWTNNVNCVIIYAHTSHKSILSLVDFYVDRIIEIEKALRVNVEVQKAPRLLVCSPEDKQRIKELFDRIENGESKLFVSVDDVDAIKNVLESGDTSVLDKLYVYKQQIENELLTFLGIDNISIEKKERLITAEAESNNDIIRYHLNCFLKPLEDGCKRISEVVGYSLTIESEILKQMESDLGKTEAIDDDFNLE